MLLSGHQAEVYSVKFSPTGQTLATGSRDKRIRTLRLPSNPSPVLWNVYSDCATFADLEGHAKAILDVQYSADGSHLYSASADTSVGAWDMESCTRIRRFRDHSSIVNSIHAAKRGDPLVCTASDDCMSMVWDTRSKRVATVLEHTFPITSVTFDDSASRICTGGVDNILRVWDLRKSSVLFEMKGHNDTITGIALSPDGKSLLSNSMDLTVRIWDLRPFATGERCLKMLTGAQHNFEKNLLKAAWSANGERVSVGSSDRSVYVWDVASEKLMYKLPGHSGSVNEVAFHPKEPIIASASSDHSVYLGELK